MYLLESYAYFTLFSPRYSPFRSHMSFRCTQDIFGVVRVSGAAKHGATDTKSASTNAISSVVSSQQESLFEPLFLCGRRTWCLGFVYRAVA
jgi:hypothetical protein